MKRPILALIALLGTSLVARAQSGFTQVSATVLDPSGTAYAGCRGNASFVPSPSATTFPTIGGSTFPTTAVIAACDSFGSFTLTLADNNQVIDGHTSPPASQWRFAMSAREGNPSFSCIITITGATQNISSQMQACAPPLPTPKANSFASVTVLQSATPSFSGNGNTGFIFLLNQSVTSSSFATAAPSGTSPVYQINICQDAVGGHTMVWPSNVTLPANYVFNLAPNSCSPVAFIYNPNTATWSPWQIIAPLGASLPFSTVPFTATPSFFGTPGGASYGMTLTGNVTSSTVTGIPANGNVMKLHICQGAGGPWTFAFPTNFINTTAIQNTGCTDETYSFDGTNWSQLTQPAGGGGGGGNCSAAGSTGTIQAAATAGACKSTNLSESAGSLTVVDNTSITGTLSASGNTTLSGTASIASDTTMGGNITHRGPNLGVDVTVSPFNARVQNPNTVVNTTGTITGGTNSLVVASNANWQQNDGLSLVGGGATNNATPPAAPTGFPAIATAPTGTGWSAAGPTGANSASYVVIAISQGGGYTAASPILTVSNTFGTLGANNIPITSCANSLGTVTCTVGSTANLGPTNTVFYGRQSGTNDDTEFGAYITATVLNGTQYSYTSGQSSLYPMTSTSSTGGTLYFWTSNRISLPVLPAGTNMYKEAVYRCYGASCALPANAANYALFHVSYPLTLANTGSDGSFGIAEDYGTSMTPNLNVCCNADWFIPTTPPAANVNDMLTTTITNISGNTFTLAANATNSTTSTPVRFDIVPAWSAAQSAAHTFNTGGGGTVHFPPAVENSGTGAYCYPVSSYFVQSGTTLLGAPLCPSVTFEQNGPLIGTYEDSIRNSRPSHSPQTLLAINCVGANPCIWRKSGAQRNFTLNIQGDMVGVFDTTGNPEITSDVNYNNSSASDLNGILYYYYNDASGTGQFGGHLTNTSWNSAAAQTIGSTSTPLFISKNGQEWVFDYWTGSLRGFYFDCNAANPACAFLDTFKQGEETQGPITPLLTFNHSAGGNVGGTIYVERIQGDSGSEPFVVNASTVGTIGAPLIINGTNTPASNMPIVSGKPWHGAIAATLAGPNLNNQLGTNHDYSLCQQANVGFTGYTGCNLPSLNLATTTYGANHTLNASEGIVIASSSGITFTLPHALAGQTWQILNPTAGTITLAIDSGTLSGNGATGPITIAANTGGLASCNGTNCSGFGFGGGGGGGSPGGIVNAIQSNNGAGGFQGTNAPAGPGIFGVLYDEPTSATVGPSIRLPGVPFNPQSGTTYTIGAANYWNDRNTLITATNGSAQTYTAVNPSITGFGFNMFYNIWNRGTAAVTETSSGFNLNGTTSIKIPPNWVAPHYSNGVDYFIYRVPDFSAFPTCVDTAGQHINFDPTATNPLFCGTTASGTGLSGMTAGQVPIAASATTVTSSEALAGAGAAITTGPASSTSLDVVEFTGTGGQIADAGFLASNVWRKDANNVSAAVNHDFSAATWKIPAGAGFTTSATSNIGLDTTAKIVHCYTNSADALCAATTSTSTTTTQPLFATAVAGVYNPRAIAGADLPAQYTKFECAPGLGDGLNAIPAGTYLQFNCVNKSGVTWTITGISCFTDNAGTSTLNAANNAATGLLTGAVTCNNTKSGGGAAGTQSATTTLANNDAISFTFVSDGVSKQTTWSVSLTQ